MTPDQAKQILGYARRMPHPHAKASGTSEAELAAAWLKGARAICSIAGSAASPPAHGAGVAAKAATKSAEPVAVTPTKIGHPAAADQTPPPISPQSSHDDRDSQSEILDSLERMGCISPRVERFKALANRVGHITASGSTSSDTSSQEEIVNSLERSGVVAPRAARVNALAARIGLAGVGK